MKLRILFALVATCAVVRAQDVPPPPRPADTGPSLYETMKFITDKIGGQGPVNFIDYFHDSTNGSDWTNKFTSELTNVRANAEGCRIDYHVRFTRDGQVLLEKDAAILLKDVAEVAVKTNEQAAKEANSEVGHPEWTHRVDPRVFILEVRGKTAPNDFDLYDESLANRIAKALVHAVELCGGGSKEPF
jgi:hypothetical protein